MLVDSHCHLDECIEAENLIRRAGENGVKKIVSCSTDLESNKKNLFLSEKFSGTVFPCFGIHPSNLLRMKESELEECVEFIKGNIGESVAIGEIGLDFKHAVKENEKKLQEKIFTEMIRIGKERGKPLVVHSRFAGGKVLEILKEENAEKVLLHWFNGSGKEFLEGIKRKYFFSAGPAITSKDYAEKTNLIPLKQLMLETDAPVEFNGKKAEPFWIKDVAERISALKEKSFAEIENSTSENALKFFGLK